MIWHYHDKGFVHCEISILAQMILPHLQLGGWLKAGGGNYGSLTKPPKVEILIWKVFNEALPSSEALAKRNIITSPICPRYATI